MYGRASECNYHPKHNLYIRLLNQLQPLPKYCVATCLQAIQGISLGTFKQMMANSIVEPMPKTLRDEEGDRRSPQAPPPMPTSPTIVPIEPPQEPRSRSQEYYPRGRRPTPQEREMEREPRRRRRRTVVHQSSSEEESPSPPTASRRHQRRTRSISPRSRYEEEKRATRERERQAHADRLARLARLEQEARDRAVRLAEDERRNRRPEFGERRSIESVGRARRRQQQEEEKRYRRREARRRQDEQERSRRRIEARRCQEEEERSRRRDEARRRQEEKDKYRRRDEARLSLDAMFEQCISNATEVAKNLPKEAASELNTIIRRIDDIHFRLQIWGSEVGANAHRQFTFDDILKLKDSVLPEVVQRILESFQHQFSTIGRVWMEFSSDSGKTMHVVI